MNADERTLYSFSYRRSSAASIGVVTPRHVLSRSEAAARPEGGRSQAAFALVLFEGLGAPLRDVGEPTVQRSQRRGIERRAVGVGCVAEILQFMGPAIDNMREAAAGRIQYCHDVRGEPRSPPAVRSSIPSSGFRHSSAERIAYRKFALTTLTISLARPFVAPADLPPITPIQTFPSALRSSRSCLVVAS